MNLLAVGMFLIFLTLKLIGVIAWPWLWVTAPLWGWCLWVILIIMVAIICAACEKPKRPRYYY